MHVRTITGGLLGVNTYIVSKDSDAQTCVLIDPGVPLSQLQSALAGQQVSAVLLTHAHFDHMLSAQPFVDAGARLYVGAPDVPALTDERLNLCGMVHQRLSLKASPVALREGDVIEEAGVRLAVIETPGHTSGGVCYCSQADGVLFSGDTLFSGGYGRIDFPGGSAQALSISLRQLCALAENTRVLCGHGEETTIAAERRMGY